MARIKPRKSGQDTVKSSSSNKSSSPTVSSNKSPSIVEAPSSRAPSSNLFDKTGGLSDKQVSELNRISNQSFIDKGSIRNARSGNKASDFINQGQEEDIADLSESSPPTRGDKENTLVSAFKNITGRDSIIPESSAPAVPSFEDSFQDLRKEYGVDGLESTINGLDAEEEELRAQLRVSTNAEIGKPVAMNVISGRVTEQERAAMERLEFVQRQKNRAVNELQTANDAISNIMSFRKMDYEVAKEKYNTEFSQNLSLFGAVKGAVEFEIGQEEREQDNARSNLQIIYNSIQSDGMDISAIDESMKTKIHKMELQAGLPQGFYENIQAENPDGEILSTTTRISNGTKYADVLTRNEDGSISVKQVQLGASGGGSNDTSDMTESEFKRKARSDAAQQLEAVAGGTGNVSVENYKTMQRAWVKAGLSGDEFNENFASTYLDSSDWGKVNYSPY